MIKSMTGYGVAEQELPLGKVAVEMRSLNHKYLDISLRLPRGFFTLEPKIRDIVKKGVSRGRVDLTMRIDPSASTVPRYRLEADTRLAEEYIHLLDSIKEKFGLKGEVTLDHIAAVREIVPFLEVKEDTELYWDEIASVTEEALQALDDSRRKEGEALEADLMGRLEQSRRLMEEIKGKTPLVVDAYRERLRERVQALLEGSDFDERRFHQEVAYFAERSDVSEEVIRMESHLRQFESKLAEEGPAGRGLDFILQEMNREVNTIGAKATDIDIAHRVIELKGELERMREQVQNIE
ncbi:MAG: YicC family protein [Deltaproteobacteria bacterium RBG_16_54_11]|nr:MAG: YicC family protein [Deltaproteobacteria bacterium RBG_16_54_11]